MSKKRLSTNDVVELLKARCNEAGSQKDFASKHGVSASYISDVLHKGREPAGVILESLGLERVVEYQSK